MPGDHGEIPMDFSPYDDIMDVYIYIYYRKILPIM